MSEREEDYPGQNNDIRREMAIRRAVETADRIIMEAANGSVEELDYLTAAVAKSFCEKTLTASVSKLLKYDLSNRRAG